MWLSDQLWCWFPPLGSDYPDPLPLLRDKGRGRWHSPTWEIFFTTCVTIYSVIFSRRKTMEQRLFLFVVIFFGSGRQSRKSCLQNSATKKSLRNGARDFYNQKDLFFLQPMRRISTTGLAARSASVTITKTSAITRSRTIISLRFVR